MKIDDLEMPRQQVRRVGWGLLIIGVLAVVGGLGSCRSRVKPFPTLLGFRVPDDWIVPMLVIAAVGLAVALRGLNILVAANRAGPDD